MTWHGVGHRISECFSRLGDGWPAGWALLGVVVVSLVILIVAGKAQARSRD